MHERDSSMKILANYVLFPAKSKETYGTYNVFAECVSILIKSRDIKMYNLISHLIDKTR